MSYSLKRIYTDFINDAYALEELIFTLQKEETSLKRDILVEGSFIRFITGLEKFIEDFFLRCMCKAKSRSGTIIKPKDSCSQNAEDAFQRLHIDRRKKDKSYMGWLDCKRLRRRAEDHFHHRSRIHAVYQDPDKWFAVKTIRNAIVHKSSYALEEFKKLVRENMDGYLQTLNPTIAELLIYKNKRQSKMTFSYYTEYYKKLASKITK
jgi:hypothetical protein